MKLDPSKFKYGIEHEFPSIDKEGKFVDFSTATFEDLDRVIEALPVFERDYPQLRVGDLGIKKKRWYIEGFERFDTAGTYRTTEVKGFEIRTPICDSIDDAVETLQQDFLRWREVAKEYGYHSATAAFNPFQAGFAPQPPLNDWERGTRNTPEDQTTYIYMLTYGPDVSFSHPDLTTEQIIAIGKKLTYYSPFIVPFSFSSPFHNGELWEGLSYRTFYRTGRRQACTVFLEHASELINTVPMMNEQARLPAEIGRIEFKAFDTVEDVTLYGPLLALVIGIALDDTLKGESFVPDTALHQLSAQKGFEDETIYNGAVEVFEAAYAALPPALRDKLEVLRPMLDLKRTPANAMVEQYKAGKSIIDIISHDYE